MLTNLSQILISLAIIINALGQNANICHLTNCETCSPLNPFICINCDSGYTRDLETGCKNSSSLIPSFQIENCLTLNQDSCLQCIPDYELFNNRCNPICQENCSCFYPGECLISLTKEFRNLVSCDTARCNSCCSGDTGYCCTCDMYYCRVCEVSSICDECGLGYGFNGANCTQCMDTNCYNCSTNDADCIICNPGYKLDGNAGCILDCDDPKCTSCTNQTTCETCITGYYLSGSTCVQCDTNCSDCTSTNTCTQCEFGNGFLNSACRACNDTYCYNCNDDYLNCILCIDGYELIEDCISVCLHDSHCKECNISQGCELCDPGFYVHENGYCTLCGLLNCNECYNTDYCEACKDGYGFSNNSCLACSDNCYNCSNDYKFCDLCYDGYSLNDLGECSVSSSSSIFSNQNIIIIASVGSGVVLM